MEKSKILICPVHGDISKSVVFFLKDEAGNRRIYCYRCIADLLDKHIPRCVVKEKGS